MKLQLIMLETPIIVSDETPEVEDIVFLGNSYNYISKVINMIGGSLRDVVLEKMPEQRKNGTLDYREMSKIIAGLPSLPSINFNGFEEQLEIVDAENFIDEFEFATLFKQLPEGKSVESNPRDTVSKNSLRKEAFKYYSIGVRETLKKVQQLNEKKFSLEDMKKAFLNGQKSMRDEYIPLNVDYYIQSLQQTSWNVEVEMEKVTRLMSADIVEKENWIKEENSKYTYYRPKITNNQIKITKIL